MIHDLAILLTCFNRKETTLKCLAALSAQITSAEISIFLCDDGSTDGTTEAVTEQFPEVHIVQGTGTLFWTRGTQKAWEAAMLHKAYDAYMWLNDDAMLNDGALQHMTECSQECYDEAIICGEFCDANGQFSYGGTDQDKKPILPNHQLQSLYYLNGNCVLIPAYVVQKIGCMNTMFLHGGGDYEYGLRALKNNIRVVTSKIYIGQCQPNATINRVRKNGLSVFGRFRKLYSPFGYHPIVDFRYRLRYFGWAKAIRTFLWLHYINLLPDSLYKK